MVVVRDKLIKNPIVNISPVCREIKISGSKDANIEIGKINFQSWESVAKVIKKILLRESKVERIRS